MTWRDRALCTGSGIDFFDGPVSDARRLCAACTVRTDCLDAVMTAEGGASASRRYGIFAGYTAVERARLAAGRTPLHANCRTDPYTVKALIDGYVQEHGHRRGAVKHAATVLGISRRTVTVHLRRIAA